MDLLLVASLLCGMRAGLPTQDPVAWLWCCFPRLLSAGACTKWVRATFTGGSCFATSLFYPTPSPLRVLNDDTYSVQLQSLLFRILGTLSMAIRVLFSWLIRVWFSCRSARVSTDFPFCFLFWKCRHSKLIPFDWSHCQNLEGRENCSAASYFTSHPGWRRCKVRAFSAIPEPNAPEISH
jgi:hypothetical protein